MHCVRCAVSSIVSVYRAGLKVQLRTTVWYLVYGFLAITNAECGVADERVIWGSCMSRVGIPGWLSHSILRAPSCNESPISS